MFRRMIGCIMSTVFATGAYASEPTAYAGSAPNWTGFYLGAHAGYGQADVDWTFAPSTTFIYAPGDQLGFEVDRAFLGGHIGYNYQMGRVVLGVEGTLSSGLGSQTFDDLTRVSTKMGGIATVAGRFGYAFDGWLGYLKAGYATARIETDFNGGETEGKVKHHGYVLGLGAETMILPNFSLGLEYNFVHLNGTEHANAPFIDAIHNVEADVHAIMARGTIHFR